MIGIFNKQGFYTTDKIKSYNARFYIVASERGLGKTYGEKKALFKNWVRRGHRFAVIFRIGFDMMKALPSWLDPLTRPAPLDKMRPVPYSDFKWVNVSGGTSADLQYKGETIGYFRCLSIANAVKHETFPLDISEVFFDEFAPQNYKKIPGCFSEGEALETIIDTMDHDTNHRKVTLGYPPIKTLMFCNPRNRSSPLYDYFGIPALRFGVHRVNRDVVCEQIEPTFESTEGGLSNAARKCSVWLETTSYVRKVPKGAQPRFSIRFGQHYYTIYYKGYSVIKRCTRHTNGCYSYIGTLDNLAEQEVSVKRKLSDGTILSMLRDRVDHSIDYFESIETKYTYIQDVFSNQW